MKLQKAQLHKIVQSGGLSTAGSATDAAMCKKMFGSDFTTPIISTEEMNEIIKTIKSLEESRLLIKGVSETIKNEVEEQKAEFIGMMRYFRC